MKPRLILWPWALASAAGLAACSGATGAGAPTPPAPVAASDPAAPTQITSGRAPANRCDAQAVQPMVGQPYAPALLAEALRASGADLARVLRADSIITKEYQAGRLNLVLDASGQRVARAYCG